MKPRCRDADHLINLIEDWHSTVRDMLRQAHNEDRAISIEDALEPFSDVLNRTYSLHQVNFSRFERVCEDEEVLISRCQNCGKEFHTMMKIESERKSDG